MKRIFITIASCLGVASCQINEGDVNLVSDYELYTYASGIMVNYVTVPVETVEALLDFDTYLSMSEVEREKDTCFYGCVTEEFDNIYSFRIANERIINCKVDTQGKSLREDGAVWVLSFLSTGHYDGEAGIENYINSFTLPEYTEISMTDKDSSEWTVSLDNVFETVLTSKGESEGRSIWSVKSSGKVTDAGQDLVARFDTGEEPIEVKERPLQYGQYMGNAYRGRFSVEIFNRNTMVDYCYLTLRPGFTARYTTSR